MATGDVSELYAAAFGEFIAGLGLPSPPLAPVDAHDRVDCGHGFVRRVGGDDYCHRVENAAARLDDRLLGFRFGSAIGGRGFGLLGVATASAPDLAASLQSLARWEPLTSTLGDIAVRQDGAQVRLVWRPHAPLPATVIEGVLAGWVAFGRFLVGEDLPVDALELAHARTVATSSAEQLVGAPVRFGADEYAVVVPAEILDAQPRYADARLHQALGGWLDDAVHVVRHGRNETLAAASASILREMAWGNVDERGVAGDLGVARRTLQRRMAEHGLSFRRLLDLLRASIAVGRLTTGNERFIDLAQRVGFAEQASFCRAVRSWTGCSPGEVNRRFSAGYAELRNARAS